MKKFIIGEFDVEETKTRRRQLLLQPLLDDDISKIAHMQRISVNELCCRALEIYRNKHIHLIAQYHEVFNDVKITGK